MYDGSIMIVQARVKGILCKHRNQILTSVSSRWGSVIRRVRTCFIASLKLRQLLCDTNPIVLRDRALTRSKSASATTTSVGTSTQHSATHSTSFCDQSKLADIATMFFGSSPSKGA